MNRKCPDDRALVRLASAASTPREKDRLLGHLAVCSRCSTRLSVLRQLKRDLAPQVEAFVGEHASSRPLRPSRFRPSVSLIGLRFAAGFIAIFLVAASGAFLALSRAARHSDLRSPAAKLSLLAPAAKIPSAPQLFRWSPVLNADNYSFELIDDSLERVYSDATFLINELALPADIQDKLIRGRTYVWTISAQDGDANVLTSRSASFVIE